MGEAGAWASALFLQGGVMNRFALFLLGGVASIMLAGCANMSGNEIHVSDSGKPNPNAAKAKYPAAVRMAGYTDGRNAGSPRKIGIATARVLGLTGTDIVLDRDVTDVAASSLRRHLDDAGIQVFDKNDTSAPFELSGVVKEFKYDVKDRDYVLIRLDTTLKEVSTGKVVWSGEVEEKNNRFAGVSGNSRGDIADYLKKELNVVTGKTAEAINAALKASHPELFVMAPGAQTIQGVTVFVTPVVTPPSPANPSLSVPANGANMAPQQPVPGGSGTLVVRTEPARAKVYVDGVYYGMSPLNIDSAAGIRVVEAKLKGYKDATEKVAVRVGATTELEFQLDK